jgi:hypothetical protein
MVIDQPVYRVEHVRITNQPTARRDCVRITYQPITIRCMRITDQPMTRSCVRITNQPTTSSCIRITGQPTTINECDSLHQQRYACEEHYPSHELGEVVKAKECQRMLG